jgi:hypothetical protein
MGFNSGFKGLIFTLASTLSLPFWTIWVFGRLLGISQIPFGFSSTNCPPATFALNSVYTDINTFGEYTLDSYPDCTLVILFVNLLNSSARSGAWGGVVVKALRY